MEINPTNDLLFKKAFATEGKENILKGLVEDLTGEKFIKVKPTVPYHISNFSENELKSTEVDIMAITEEGEYVTIEMQVFPHQFFLERTLYYTCEAYRKSYADKQK